MTDISFNEVTTMKMRGLWLSMCFVVLATASCGYPQLPELAGRCRIDDDCGAHEFCEDSGSAGTCTCVAGYMPGDAGCAWAGVVADPGFGSASVWTAKNQATINPTATDPGLKEPGFATFTYHACGAALEQHVVMPRYVRAEPLVAVITYRTTNSGAPEPTFGIGSAWTAFPLDYSANWKTARRCLGGGQYAAPTSAGRGEEVLLTVGEEIRNGCWIDKIDIDHFEIVPAAPGECPVPGEVPNGLADDDGGWTFLTSDGGMAGFAPDIGENGTRGVKLVLPHRCSVAIAKVPFSSGPMGETGSPALSYYLATGTGTQLQAQFDHGSGAYAFPLVQGLPPATFHACVPAPQRGTFGMLVAKPNLGNGICGDPVSGAVALDTVVLRDEPGCGRDPAITDPGFESGYLPLGIRGNIASIFDPSAHSGTRMLEMKRSSCSDLTSFSVDVIVPSPMGAAGPSLTFWYRMTPGTYTHLTWSYPETYMMMPRSTQWAQGRLCIDPKLGGRALSVALSLDTDACPASGFPTESTFLDDLSVTTDPMCPAM